MNKRGHVLNAVLLGIGVGFLLNPSVTQSTLRTIAMVTVPITMGALFPDIDTEFGTHRQTFHNLATLVIFIVFPVYFDNLYFVWIGVLTHYILDLLGTEGGMRFFYPARISITAPFGVNVDSPQATGVTLAVTVVEIVAIGILIRLGFGELLRAPSVWNAVVSAV